MSYTTLNSSYSSTLTLTAGTYYMSADVDMQSNAIVVDASSGNVILKRNGDVKFSNITSFTTTNTSSSNIFYMTVKDDDTIGETISGSTGSPSASGGYIQEASITGNCYLNYVEVRWATRQLIRCSSNQSFTYITFKNCDYDSTNLVNGYVLYQDSYVGSGEGTTRQIHHIYFDDTNTLTTAAGLIKFSNRIPIHDIVVDAANTTVTTGIIYENIFSNHSYTSYNIKIINSAAGKGFATGDRRRTNFSVIDFKDCNCNISVITGYTGYFYVKNCLFNANDLNSYGSARANWYFKVESCIFDSLSYTLIDYATHGSRTIRYYIYNSIFNNSYNIFYSRNSAARELYNCGLYNYSFYVTPAVETGSITTDPSFQNSPSGCTIDTTFDDYIPDGYFVGNLTDYQFKGSDTFDNLSIDETEYTATGYQYNGTIKITPGLNYKVTSFATTNIRYVFGDFSLKKITVDSLGKLKLIATCDKSLSKFTIDSLGKSKLITTSSINLNKLEIECQAELVTQKIYTGSCDNLELKKIEVNSENILKHSSENIEIELQNITLDSEGTLKSVSEAELNLSNIEITSENTLKHSSEDISLELQKIEIDSSTTSKFETISEINFNNIEVNSENILKHSSEDISLELQNIEVDSSTTNKFEASSELNLSNFEITSDNILKHSSEDIFVELQNLGIYSSSCLKHPANIEIELQNVTLDSSGTLKTISDEVELNLSNLEVLSENTLKHSSELISIELQNLEVDSSTTNKVEASSEIELNSFEMLSEVTIDHEAEEVQLEINNIDVDSSITLKHISEDISIELQSLDIFASVQKITNAICSIDLNNFEITSENTLKHNSEDVDLNLQNLELDSSSTLKIQSIIDLELKNIEVDSFAYCKTVRFGTGDLELSSVLIQANSYLKHLASSYLNLNKIELEANVSLDFEGILIPNTTFNKDYQLILSKFE